MNAICVIPVRALATMALAALLLQSAGECAGATIEFLSGAKLECTVLSKDDKSVTVEVAYGERKVQRTLPLSTIHRVTIGEKQYVINEKPAAGATSSGAASPTAPKTPAMATAAAGSSPRGSGNTRTVAEIDALIAERGRTPPDWYQATLLNYPPSLDLAWPEPAPGGWNNQKNVGQYIWDIINPNPHRWREGVKLMHHLLVQHKDDPAKRLRVMNELGSMYFRFFEDHARAAFWWRQAGVDKSLQFPQAKMHLAECYWRLGNRDMALQILNGSQITYQGVKLLGDMGETARCVQLATQAAGAARWPSELYLIIGDAHRVAGDLDKALAAKPSHVREEKFRVRAGASADAIRLIEKLDIARIPDGEYTGASIGYEGMVEVHVTVAQQRIETVRIGNHKEKQFYSALTDTPAKIIARQGLKGVDATSGATITSEAIINATAKALGNR
jgi:uncharacterized protein with FMN-binding domain